MITASRPDGDSWHCRDRSRLVGVLRLTGWKGSPALRRFQSDLSVDVDIDPDEAAAVSAGRTKSAHSIGVRLTRDVSTCIRDGITGGDAIKDQFQRLGVERDSRMILGRSQPCLRRPDTGRGEMDGLHLDL